MEACKSNTCCYARKGPIWTSLTLNGWFTWDPKSQVPFTSTSPTMKAKPNLWASITHWSIVYICESQILIILCKFLGLVLLVGSSSFLHTTLNTSLKPHLHTLLPCRHPCHTWNLGLGTRMKWYVATSMLSTAKITRTNLAWIRTWIPMWIGPKGWFTRGPKFQSHSC
jgi:hypothetical protein